MRVREPTSTSPTAVVPAMSFPDAPRRSHRTTWIYAVRSPGARQRVREPTSTSPTTVVPAMPFPDAPRRGLRATGWLKLKLRGLDMLVLPNLLKVIHEPRP